MRAAAVKVDITDAGNGEVLVSASATTFDDGFGDIPDRLEQGSTRTTRLISSRVFPWRPTSQT
ncbi:hypothetical protein [Corynebacterium halotolerans]|uniref:hypothetical protein n=1 Tax=Corynebacterium halotolerans TaxID=225326 RepID=UPI003CC733F1